MTKAGVFCEPRTLPVLGLVTQLFFKMAARKVTSLKGERKRSLTNGRINLGNARVCKIVVSSKV